MPSGYILEDGSFKEHIDYPDKVETNTFSDSVCGRAEAQAAADTIVNETPIVEE